MGIEQRRETVETLLRLFHECEHPRDRVTVARALITCERIALEESRASIGA